MKSEKETVHFFAGQTMMFVAVHPHPLEASFITLTVYESQQLVPWLASIETGSPILFVSIVDQTRMYS